MYTILELDDGTFNRTHLSLVVKKMFCDGGNPIVTSTAHYFCLWTHWTQVKIQGIVNHKSRGQDHWF